jgi:hypothetical protein
MTAGADGNIGGVRSPSLGLLRHGLRDNTATKVQQPFATSLSPLNNEFWNHDRILESRGGEGKEW